MAKLICCTCYTYIYVYFGKVIKCLRMLFGQLVVIAFLQSGVALSNILRLLWLCLWWDLNLFTNELESSCITLVRSHKYIRRTTHKQLVSYKKHNSSQQYTHVYICMYLHHSFIPNIYILHNDLFNIWVGLFWGKVKNPYSEIYQKQQYSSTTNLLYITP